MIYYKLTNTKGQTYRNTQWGPGISHTATGRRGQGLCSSEYIHAYSDPLCNVLHEGHNHSRRRIQWINWFGLATIILALLCCLHEARCQTVKSVNLPPMVQIKPVKGIVRPALRQTIKSAKNITGRNTTGINTTGSDWTAVGKQLPMVQIKPMEKGKIR